MKFLFIHTHVTLEYFNFKRENGFKRFAVYLTVAKRLLEEMAAIHIWIITIIPSATRSISECIPTTNKIYPLIPYLKHCGDLVWCMPWHMLTLCKRTVTHRLHQTSGNSHQQAAHQCNFTGSLTLPSLDSIIHYCTLHYCSVCIMSMLVSIVGVSIR